MHSTQWKMTFVFTIQFLPWVQKLENVKAFALQDPLSLRGHSRWKSSRIEFLELKYFSVEEDRTSLGARLSSGTGMTVGSISHILDGRGGAAAAWSY